MKYRVKFQCYWYNTGAADNHHYTNFEDFDTIEEAEKFLERVNMQYEMSQKRIVYSWEKYKPTEYEIKYDKLIKYEDFEKWNNSENHIEVENGFISGYGTIVKYFPEREENL